MIVSMHLLFLLDGAGVVSSELTRSLARAVVKLGSRVSALEDKVRMPDPSIYSELIVGQLEDALREITKLREVANGYMSNGNSSAAAPSVATVKKAWGARS